MLYKDISFVKNRLLLFQIYFAVYDIILLFLDVQIILFFVNHPGITYTIFILVQVVPAVMIVCFLVGCAFVFVNVGAIAINYRYLFQTVVDMQLDGSQIHIQCDRKRYTVTREQEIEIKNILFNRMMRLKLSDGRRFYIWRYRMDGSGEMLLDEQYFKQLFPTMRNRVKL